LPSWLSPRARRRLDSRADYPNQEIAMSTSRLLNLTALAGFTFTVFDELTAQAADQPSAPIPVAPAAAQPKANPAASRPLTAKDVWGHDYAQAQRQARTLNRPVLMHFHATWCGPCQQMERTVLNTNEVLKEIDSRCVAIKVDSDKQPHLVQQFGVNALPCDVFVGSDGKILKVNQGAVSADQYKALIANAAPTKAVARVNVKVASN
jgi:thioredoxin-like negative regulator of GroEL